MSLQSKMQQRAIERLIELHKINYNRVDFTQVNAAHAIYFLQGGAITTAINARKLVNEAGMLAREWRFASEISATVEYFDELEPNSKDLNAWLNKGVLPERKPIKSKKTDSTKRQEISGLSEEHFQLQDQIQKRLINELSRFAHPTLQSVRYNSKKFSHEFDYYQTYTDDQAELEKYHSTYVSEAISCFLFPVRSLPLPIEQRIELRDMKVQLNDYFKS